MPIAEPSYYRTSFWLLHPQACLPNMKTLDRALVIKTMVAVMSVLAFLDQEWNTVTIYLGLDMTITIQNPFANEMPSSRARFCLTHRGIQGRWVQDWEYAKTAQYDTYPFNISKLKSQLDWQKKRDRFAQQRFGPTPDAPFRWATSWRWQDDLCNVSLISLEGLCQLSDRLHISRYHAVGDSINLCQFLLESCWERQPDGRLLEQGSAHCLPRAFARSNVPSQPH